MFTSETDVIRVKFEVYLSCKDLLNAQIPLSSSSVEAPIAEERQQKKQ